MEVFSSSLGAVAVVFALNKKDEEKLAEILGAMGIVSILSANPIMGIFVTALGGYAYWKERRRFDGKGIAKGATLTLVSAGIFSILGLPILLELVIVMVVGTLLRKHLFDNKAVLTILEQNLSRAGSTASVLCSRVIDDLAPLLTRLRSGRTDSDAA